MLVRVTVTSAGRGLVTINIVLLSRDPVFGNKNYDLMHPLDWRFIRAVTLLQIPGGLGPQRATARSWRRARPDEKGFYVVARLSIASLHWVTGFPVLTPTTV